MQAHGAVVDHLEVGTGLAVYKTEDPSVCRLVASWLCLSRSPMLDW